VLSLDEFEGYSFEWEFISLVFKLRNSQYYEHSLNVFANIIVEFDTLLAKCQPCFFLKVEKL
jgi:hypothetical protein